MQFTARIAGKQFTSGTQSIDRALLLDGYGRWSASIRFCATTPCS
jgi:hypothetical protein